MQFIRGDILQVVKALFAENPTEPLVVKGNGFGGEAIGAFRVYSVFVNPNITLPPDEAIYAVITAHLRQESLYSSAYVGIHVPKPSIFKANPQKLGWSKVFYLFYIGNVTPQVEWIDEQIVEALELAPEQSN